MRVFFTLIFSTFAMILMGQGSEDFLNLPTTSSTNYLARTWTGTNSVTWTAEGARTDQTMSGKAICFGNSGITRSVTSPLYANGMGTLSFDYVRAFTGTNGRSIQVFVNGTQIGTDIVVSATSDVVQNYSQPINVAGNVELEIISIGAAQVKIDNISWTSYVPAPVKFSLFNLEKFNYNSIVSFSTVSETNNDYFTIERSGDGRNFESIGAIKGAGNSNQELSYEFVDESPLAGINYYRIKQTDFDGAYSYTEIRSVRHQTKNVIVSPNRTDGKLNVTSELDNYNVAIYNTSGQEVQRHLALSGDQSLSIEALQAGVYFVKVMDQTIRIVKF